MREKTTITLKTRLFEKNRLRKQWLVYECIFEPNYKFRLDKNKNSKRYVNSLMNEPVDDKIIEPPTGGDFKNKMPMHNKMQICECINEEVSK